MIWGMLLKGTYQMNINYEKLPTYMIGGIKLYIEDGIKPGSFLVALLSNDLMGAFTKADDANSRMMRDWVMFLYNDAPSSCFGSPEAYKEWIKVGGLNGITENENE
jgi:hypothetical protein